MSRYAESRLQIAADRLDELANTDDCTLRVFNALKAILDAVSAVAAELPKEDGR